MHARTYTRQTYAHGNTSLVGKKHMHTNVQVQAGKQQQHSLHIHTSAYVQIQLYVDVNKLHALHRHTIIL